MKGTYIYNVLISIDQFGNALTGGNPDCTISGRTGYFSRHSIPQVRWFWLALEKVIDTTFYPFDGPGHCLQAYEKEKLNEFYELNSFRGPALFLLANVTLLSCSVMIVPFYCIYWLRLFVDSIQMK